MRIDQELTHTSIVNGLSALIAQTASSVASEQYHPSSDPDRMDDTIREGKKKLAALRKLRDDFENVMSGVIL